MLRKRKIIYIAAVMLLIIMMDNAMAKDDRLTRLSSYFAEEREYYERYEEVLPPIIIYEEIVTGNEATEAVAVVNPVDNDIVDAGAATSPPILNITQKELDHIYKREDKIAYFTFDDGPSATVTPYILDILKEENIKATFFILGKSAEKHPELIRRIYEEGHMLANHTYTHNYALLYKSPDGLLQELEETEALIKEILGLDYPLRLMRFPGGSFGDKDSFKKIVNEKGFVYLDWNCLNGDAEGLELTEERLIRRFESTAAKSNTLVILVHDTDTKSINIKLLPEMIEYLRAGGYTFDSLQQVIKGDEQNKGGEQNKIDEQNKG